MKKIFLTLLLCSISPLWCMDGDLKTKVEIKICNKCETSKDEEVPLKRCGVCKAVYYCSKECQRADWHEHKKVCQQENNQPRKQPASQTSTSSERAVERDELQNKLSFYHLFRVVTGHQPEALDEEAIECLIKRLMTKGAAINGYMTQEIYQLGAGLNELSGELEKGVIALIGLTPLHLAALANKPKACKALITCGANIEAPLEVLLDTPLIMAAVQGHIEACKALMECGANLNACGEPFGFVSGKATVLEAAEHSGIKQELLAYKKELVARKSK